MLSNVIESAHLNLRMHVKYNLPHWRSSEAQVALDSVLDTMFDEVPRDKQLRLSDGRKRGKRDRMVDTAEKVLHGDAQWALRDEHVPVLLHVHKIPTSSCMPDTTAMESDESLFRDPQCMQFFRDLREEKDSTAVDDSEDLHALISALSGSGAESSAASRNRPLSLVGQKHRDAHAVAEQQRLLQTERANQDPVTSEAEYVITGGKEPEDSTTSAVDVPPELPDCEAPGCTDMEKVSEQNYAEHGDPIAPVPEPVPIRKPDSANACSTDNVPAQSEFNHFNPVQPTAVIEINTLTSRISQWMDGQRTANVEHISDYSIADAQPHRVVNPLETSARSAIPAAVPQAVSTDVPVAAVVADLGRAPLSTTVAQPSVEESVGSTAPGCGIRIFGDVWHPLPRGGGSKKQIPKCPQIGYHPPPPADGVKRGAFDRRKNNRFTDFFSCG